MFAAVLFFLPQNFQLIRNSTVMMSAFLVNSLQEVGFGGRDKEEQLVNDVELPLGHGVSTTWEVLNLRSLPLSRAVSVLLLVA